MPRFPVLHLFILVSVLLLVFFIAIRYGPVTLSLTEVVHAVMAGYWHSDTAGTLHQRIVWSLRIPRTLLAALAGAALALAGTVLQTLTRNPLSDPWILGISSGAGCGAVVVIALGLSAGWAVVPAGAFSGAMLAFALVLIMARQSLSGQSGRFLLTGVAVTQLLSALTSLITLWKTDSDTTRGVMFWLLGSFAQASWLQVMLCALTLLLVFTVCLCLSRELDVLTSGSITAQSLGIEEGAVRLTLYCMLTLLTAVVVACCGAIGFIGLTVPHIARIFTGYRHCRLLPASMLCGAVFTVLADTLARTLFSPRELPVGILTALLGVPVFLFLNSRQQR
ncbi:iron ABC transporter permease [Salmonella enterica subsp. diarizonae]|uniref:Iron ABC transporter permease n=1 Tax=Salmonella diarizonae TaxID=59204 RepID=A0A5Y3W9Q7_SALDZ|nr:iron ABC transporter permease [Salmonella enterica subsp. diarizonae]ECJ4379995.1 iron ABC transporter permease [Salmonella enterica subsp. diarizonae]